MHNQVTLTLAQQPLYNHRYRGDMGEVGLAAKPQADWLRGHVCGEHVNAVQQREKGARESRELIHMACDIRVNEGGWTDVQLCK